MPEHASGSARPGEADLPASAVGPGEAPFLVIEFGGWCMIRQPTDPDPYDEPRGVSGYTFAFGDEPDLNRVIYLHPNPASPLRSHGPEIGVSVVRAVRFDGDGMHTIDGLSGARFDLLDDPILENRNWALTLPGYEPITPFNIEITSADGALRIRRDVPLDPDHPNLPAWQLEKDVLTVKGARGLAFEPETVGRATGLWDFLQLAIDRRDLLQKDLDEARTAAGDGPEVEALVGRIRELDIGIENPKDRRIGVRQIIERFGFPLTGAAATIEDPHGVLGGKLADTKDAQWRIDFWMGGWDADALSCYMEGALNIPYATPPASSD